MSKVYKNALFGKKKAPAGCLHSKTKVFNIFWNIPESIRTKFDIEIIQEFAKTANQTEQKQFTNVIYRLGGQKLLWHREWRPR